jgi:predicted ester cyclase
MGVPPTHKDVTMEGIAIHRVVDGKIVEHWSQVDGLGLLMQMGAIPPPA